jgi:adhesin transport system membrane fusion protein
MSLPESSSKELDVRKKLPQLENTTSGATRYLRKFDIGLEGWRRMERPRMFVIFFTFVLLALLVWTLLSRVDRVVRAEGRVIPAGRSQVIQHLEGGIVSAISTREGALVKKGEVLLSISDTGAGSRLGEVQVKKGALRAKITRLQAELNGLPLSDEWRKEPEMAARLEAEGRLFQERQTRTRNEIDVLREQAKQKQAEQADLEGRRVSVAKELEISRSQLQVMAGLAAKKAASELEILESRGRVQKLETQLRELEGAIPKTRATIGEIEAKIRVTQSQFRTEARSDLTSAQSELDRLVEEERAEKDKVDRTDIRAPVNGIVNKLIFNTLGGVVRPGDTIMEVTPLDGKVLIEAKVSPAERGQLRPGLPVRARITAYDFGIHGTLPGRLIEVSADTVSEARSAGIPYDYYRVQVEIDTSSYNDKSLPVLPGMTASVDIVAGQRTIMQYLLSPLLRFNYHVFQESK